MIQAVIFDMDGLLIDSEPHWHKAFRKSFSEIGITLTQDDINSGMGKKPLENTNFFLSEYNKKDIDPHALVHKIYKIVIRLTKKNGELIEGAREVVQLFRNKNIPIAVATSSPELVMNEVLKHFQIKSYMRVLHSADKEPYGKPNPGVFITTAQKLGIDPVNCLVFEDAPNGVLAAKAAQMKCIAVPSNDVKDDKRFCIADKVLRSLIEFRFEDIEKL